MRYYLQHLETMSCFTASWRKEDRLDRLVMETSRDRLTLRNRGVYSFYRCTPPTPTKASGSHGKGSKIIIEDESCLIPDEIESPFSACRRKGKDAMYVKISNPFYRNHFYRSIHRREISPDKISITGREYESSGTTFDFHRSGKE